MGPPNPFVPNRLFPDQGDPFAASAPTQADAYTANAQAYQSWLAQQRASGVASGMIDPQTGWPTSNALVDAFRQYGGAMLASTSAPGAKMPGLIAYHGTDAADLSAFDLSKTGDGATAGRWAAGYKPEPQVYLATEPSHAAAYGEHIHKFEINSPLLEKDAASELESWAKDMKYKNAQDMIDNYYDGNAYDALNADQYFADAVRQARAAGFPGTRVSFGDLKDSVSGQNRKVGDVIVLHDPSVATKVSDQPQ